MNEDIERLLVEFTPRGPAQELRGRVLAAVGDELAVAQTSAQRWLLFQAGLVAAAALVASLLMNFAVNATIDRRLAAVLGPPPLPRQVVEIAAEIAALTDDRTGEWVSQRLAASRAQSTDNKNYPLRLQELTRQVLGGLEEPSHETPEENPHVDRDRSSSIDRHSPDGQRLLRLEHRNCA